MTTQNEQVVSTLNDVVEILNDRIHGYEKAIQDVEIEDVDLKAMFAELVHESRSFRNELNQEIVNMGGTPEEGTTFSGKVHKAWMDLKAAFTGKDREAILSSCEYGDQAAIEAYEEALKEEEVPAYLRTTLTNQLNSIRDTHDRISIYLKSAPASR